jgi:two-component system, sensor histidine kinase and response regulator
MQQRVKCLLVDDLEENLLALSALLRRDDVEVLTARSGSEALELLRVHEVALALLDVQMPKMDGFELAELMRGSERTREVPIIFVTAAARDQHRLFKGYETGAVDFLYKPIEPHILEGKAEVFFRLHRQKQQLAQQLREQTETLRLNEMFTAVLGHDLRNPLSAILMAAHIVQQQSDSETVRATAKRILLSGKRMTRMIDDMLDLARARLAGGIPLKVSHTDVAEPVQRVVREYEIAFPERRIELKQDGDLAGDWDADRLAQVASNLIGNALQHGSADHVIQVHLDGTGAEGIVLSVINVGRIPEHMVPHLFEPFQGGQRQPGQNQGLGLGLYIVRQIVQAHQGSVDVQCEDAEHTHFRVLVPRRAPIVCKV